MNHEELMQQLAKETAVTICDLFGMTYPAVGFMGSKHWHDVTSKIRSYGDEIYKMGYRQGIKDCSEKAPPPMPQNATVGGGNVVGICRII